MTDSISKHTHPSIGNPPQDSLVVEQNSERAHPSDEQKSTFANYRGIGNPGMASGRDAVLRKIEELRGR